MTPINSVSDLIAFYMTHVDFRFFGFSLLVAFVQGFVRAGNGDEPNMSGALPLSGLWDLGGEPVLHDGTPCLTHAWLLALSQQRPVAQVIGTLDPWDLAYIWMLPLSGMPVITDATLTLLVEALDQGGPSPCMGRIRARSMR